MGMAILQPKAPFSASDNPLFFKSFQGFPAIPGN
jgi:hypothetical protein